MEWKKFLIADTPMICDFLFMGIWSGQIGNENWAFGEEWRKPIKEKAEKELPAFFKYV